MAKAKEKAVIKWSEKEAAIRALEKDGVVDPLDLIEAAKNPSHPCHDDFTWDVDKAAAERWRDQARELIRRVHFEVHVDEETVSVVMYVRDDSSGGDESDDSATFRSLPKIRSKVTTGSILATEVAMLHGMAARVYGIAVSKANLIGEEKVAVLLQVRDALAELKAEFDL